MRSRLSGALRTVQSPRVVVREHPVIFIACVWQIETSNDPWKHSSQIAHPRHRSVTGFLVNLVAGLVAYSYQPKKTSLGLRRNPTLPLLLV
jgi:hypothetical protein